MDGRRLPRARERDRGRGGTRPRAALRPSERRLPAAAVTVPPHEARRYEADPIGTHGWTDAGQLALALEVTSGGSVLPARDGVDLAVAVTDPWWAEQTAGGRDLGGGVRQLEVAGRPFRLALVEVPRVARPACARSSGADGERPSAAQPRDREHDDRAAERDQPEAQIVDLAPDLLQDVVIEPLVEAGLGPGPDRDVGARDGQNGDDDARRSPAPRGELDREQRHEYGNADERHAHEQPERRKEVRGHDRGPIVLTLRDVLPEPLRERARLALARRLEGRLRRSSAVRGAALVFHGVARLPGDPLVEIEPAYGLGAFEAVVAYLSRRYRLVAAGALLDAARERRAGEPVPVALTFDDDLRSHLDHAAPALARHGAPATAFLGGVDEQSWWQALQAAVDERAVQPDGLPPVDPDLVRRALDGEPRAIRRLAAAVEALAPDERAALAKGLARLVPAEDAPLGSDGIRALAAAGWEIGFHTVRHDALPTLDEGGLRDAFATGRDELAVLVGARLGSFAYPHGKAGDRERAAAAAAGFDFAFTGAAEVVTERTDPFLVGRLQPVRSTLGRVALQLARALQEAA